jgi:hypothetical protein
MSHDHVEPLGRYLADVGTAPDPSTGGAAGQTATPDNADPGSKKPQNSHRTDPRRRFRLSVWVWPAITIVAVALAMYTRSSSPGRTSGPTDLTGRAITPMMLKGLNLRGATLAGTKLDGLSLIHKSLNGAVAPGSSFIGSDLQKVPMRGAELPGANFSRACLRHADLAGAELNGANITGADMTGVRLPPSVRRTMIGKPASPGTRIRSCH